MSVIERTFPYLLDTSAATGSGCVADLSFYDTMEPWAPLAVCDGAIEIIAVPVEHGVCTDGELFISNGFIINRQIVYMSDVSRIPEPAFVFIQKTCAPEGSPLTLILDCIDPDMDLLSHMGWPECQRVIERLKPGRTFLVGMCHRIEHEEFSKRLPSNVHLAYDGMCIDL